MTTAFNKLAYTPANNTHGIEVFCDIRIADESGAPLHCIGTVSENIHPFNNLPEFTMNDARRYAILFASAPELYEALREIIEVLRKEARGTPLNNHKFDALGAKALKAIAKAEGK